MEPFEMSSTRATSIALGPFTLSAENPEENVFCLTPSPMKNMKMNRNVFRQCAADRVQEGGPGAEG